MLDYALRGGFLVDGSGAPGRRADVGILGDTVACVGDVPAAHSELSLDGLVVSPGFVDPHSHSDLTLHANREAQSTIRQGVTTEVVGNCGVTNAPVSDCSASVVTERLHSYGYDDDPAWRSFGEYLNNIESAGTSQNLAFFVGHSTLREASGIYNAERPDERALTRMEKYLEEALEAGVLGMSTGLEYSYGAFASTREVQQLARILGVHGGIYTSHVRNRDSRIFQAIKEFLSIVREGNCAGQISHLNVRHDTNAPEQAWERAVDMMMQARATGLDVQADTTPFLDGSGLMTGILPPWFLSDGPASAARALEDESVRAKLRGDCDRYWRFIHKGQWGRVRLHISSEFPELAGLTFEEIADIKRRDPWDCYFDILQAAGPGMVNLQMVGRLFTEEHSADMVAHPLFSLGVDTFSSAAEGPLAGIIRSPQPFSGHVHYLTHHVRESRTLTLEEAVHKMTAKPATRFGLRRRGLIREGYFADLVVYNFQELRSDATFEEPTVYPEGIDLVMVNGTVVVEGRRHTGSRPGRVLRRAAG